ncbi:HK97 family phage prohead protease [Litoreibacter roseus]|uniref:Peptidase U35 n=1 Tax=Litoreibacter roseus TaxID=2601869 RepID=A0A6N6JK62_9RHOB|nr:HK97 family phage prohead protease [Litoreibacter roseus]GFE66711.1 peptidase U35 [Litoreibacter roseus]
MTAYYGPELERKYCQISDHIELGSDATISGYASLFGAEDQGGDIVQRGAYAKSLDTLKMQGISVKLLWQHDPATPIGVWDDVYEDERGLFVKGRLLTETQKGREAAALIEAGAIDGLSIGYRTVKADRDANGRRQLAELELWEVSLVTFPMLQQARVGAKAEALAADPGQDLAGVLRTLRRSLKAGPAVG